MNPMATKRGKQTFRKCFLKGQVANQRVGLSDREGQHLPLRFHLHCPFQRRDLVLSHTRCRPAIRSKSIIDETGMKQLPQRSVESQFEIITQRSATRTIMITSIPALDEGLARAPKG